jgi:hypothetical protein
MRARIVVAAAIEVRAVTAALTVVVPPAALG